MIRSRIRRLGNFLLRMRGYYDDRLPSPVTFDDDPRFLGTFLLECGFHGDSTMKTTRRWRKRRYVVGFDEPAKNGSNG